MARADKTLARMRENPQDNWRIAQLETVAKRYGVNVRKPSGSHVIFEHPEATRSPTVPARRPIKPVYIRSFVAFIDEIRNE
jgi:predicted RNA binding protein YcfA (HicA-like mRNA interferase family)